MPFVTALLAATACTSESHVNDHRAVPVGTTTPTPTPRPAAIPPIHLSLPTPIPTPSPAPIVAASEGKVVALEPYAAIDPPQPQYGTLSHAELLDVLNGTGWPAERLQEALRVACGSPPRWPSGESGCRPGASNGQFKGLFQLDTPFWFNHCGTDASAWADPYVNAATALCVGEYDLAGGQDFWAQWEVKP